MDNDLQEQGAALQQGEVQAAEEEQQQLGQGEVQATEEEQQQLEQLMGVAIEIIHGEGQTGDQVAKMVLESQDITVGIGGATSAVLIAAEKAVGAIPDDMKIQLALEIVAELSGLAVEAGALAEDEVDDSFIDGVVSNAYSSYLSTKESMGELDPAELEQSVSEAEQLMGTSVRGGGQNQPQQEQSATQGGLLSMAGG